jgi:two-component system, OmpR family, alkaline phosphatase synthesis response regulator PhoP
LNRIGAMEKILIIEHDRATQRVLKLLFEGEGYRVETGSDGRIGLAAFRRSRPNLVILDLELPRVSGRDVCHKIKKEVPSLPLLVLTAVADEAEKVQLLDLGADDYVTTPFSARELVARVRSLIRRQHEQLDHRYIRFDDVSVDLLEMSVTRAGRPVHLTGRELRIVEHLLRVPGQVVLRQELLSKVCGDRRGRFSRAVKNHISHLRQKLERDPKKPSHFVTVHGVGYKFVQ